VMSLVVNAVLVGALMPSIVFMTLAGVFGGILNANNIFGPLAFGPAAMNLAIISAALVGVWLLRLDELRYMADLARDMLRRRAGTAVSK